MKYVLQKMTDAKHNCSVIKQKLSQNLGTKNSSNFTWSLRFEIEFSPCLYKSLVYKIALQSDNKEEEANEILFFNLCISKIHTE